MELRHAVFIVPSVALIGFALFLLFEIASEPYPRSIWGPAMEVDAGSRVISLLTPFVLRLTIPVLMIVVGVLAILAFVAVLCSMDAAVIKVLSNLISGEAQKQS
jgi:hypothetical protein